MSNMALYDALTEAGASKSRADKAAKNVLPAKDAATKADIVRLEKKIDVGNAESKAGTARLENRLGGCSVELEKSFDGLERSLDSLEERIEEAGRNIIRWMFITAGVEVIILSWFIILWRT